MDKLRFRALPLDKWQWHPSPIPGLIVYVTTVDRAGTLDLAPKSWVSMAAFSGPIIGFGCNEQHRTCANAVDTGRFTINFPTADQARRAGAIADAHHRDRIAVSGLTVEESTTGVAHLAQCPAHVECRMVDMCRFEGGEVFLFGKIEEIAVREDILNLPPEQAYAALAPVFFLESGVVAGLGRIENSVG